MTAALWVLVAVLLGLLLVGVAAGLSAWSGASRRTARAVLDVRLARGEIDLEEHGRRTAAVAGAGWDTRTLVGIAAVMATVGLVGVVVVASSWSVSPGPVGTPMMGGRDVPGMMNGRGTMSMMGSMMSSMMGTGTCPPSAESSRQTKITITGYRYCPGTMRVPRGSSVTWINEDPVAHTVTSTTRGSFDSDTIQPGGTWTFRFSRTGSLEYYCEYHPWMRAAVEVSSTTR